MTPSGKVLRHGQSIEKPVRLSVVRGNLAALGGQVRGLRRLEHACRRNRRRSATGSGITNKTKGRIVKLETLEGSTAEAPRFSTGNGELDRVTGGGIVPGSAILIGGEPGIGKSTLLLQLTANFANAGRRAVYFSGEEAIAQVRLRAERLGLSDAPVGLASETNLVEHSGNARRGPPA